MTERKNPTWPDRALKQFKAQPLRTTVMVMLMAAMALLWVRHFAAGGSAKPAVASNKPPATIVSSATVSAGPQTLSKAAAALREFLDRPPVEIRRNLFAVKLEHFRSDGMQLAANVQGGGFLNNWAKWVLSKADQENARRFLIVNLKEKASKLNIQSTMASGDTLMALINGKLVSEGDIVAGFKIVRIELNRVYVEREGIKFEVPFGVNR